VQKTEHKSEKKSNDLNSMAKVPHGALSGHLSSMKSNETYKLSCILAILLQDNDLLRSTKQREKEKKKQR
jgi:hypothetical protein